MTAAAVPTHFVAFCDECRCAKTFHSERARELWLKFHPHDDEVDE